MHARALQGSAGRPLNTRRSSAKPRATPAGGSPVLTSTFVTEKAADVVAEPAAAAAPAAPAHANGSPSPSSVSPRYAINVIPRSRWPDGVPPVMGGHLLASKVAAPLSTSKGAGVGVHPPVVPYPPTPADAPDGSYPISVSIHGSAGALGAALVAEVKAAADAAIKKRGAFALAVSGGSVHGLLADLSKCAGPDASKWTVFLADERCVPGTAPECNVAAARAAWAASAGVTLLPDPPADDGLASDPARAAQAAAGALLGAPRASIPVVAADGGAALLPAFDLVLLGLGPDGHVAGLFPNDAPTLGARPCAPWVLPVPGPSPTAPHVPRWTLSLPALNAAGAAIIAVTGSAKAAAVARSLETQALPGAAPAQLLRPAGGVTWLVDADAGADLSPGKWGDAKAWQRSAVGGAKE